MRALRMDHLHTLDEIAKDLGVTRERVRQIEERALYKLKRRMRREGYEPFTEPPRDEVMIFGPGGSRRNGCRWVSYFCGHPQHQKRGRV